VIQAQVGHVAPEMMKTYSHIRRQALNEAAAALEPTASQPAPRPPAVTDSDRDGSATSHFTSQNDVSVGRVLRFVRKIGSPHWTISATG
jgi:hypothetical protein